MAQMCIALHWTPAQYWACTIEEAEAIAREYNRIHRKR